MHLILATNSVPARAPALRFWVWHFAKSGCRYWTQVRSVRLFKSTAGTGLTIRSSRARFAASALAGYHLTIANAAQRPGLAQALGAYLQVDIHRHVKDSHDQQHVTAVLFVIDDVTPVRELPVALANFIAFAPHGWILRQGMEYLINLPQVSIPLTNTPSLLGELRD